ncbi:hypothetical protein BKA64DRAFT_650762 [Cadophora sp. MPI-SDFR-AT-0126]|nr:hypothetical protein BKA64DRAFT_650762 [Leotiomycetes sp. MPI-SDFR-AT-0126]
MVLAVSTTIGCFCISLLFLGLNPLSDIPSSIFAMIPPSLSTHFGIASFLLLISILTIQN